MYHLYKQQKQGHVVIIATRSNRHTLADIKDVKSRGLNAETRLFIRECPISVYSCAICQIEIARNKHRGGRPRTRGGLNRNHQTTGQRRRAMRDRRERGESVKSIAAHYGVTGQTVYQALRATEQKDKVAL